MQLSGQANIPHVLELVNEDLQRVKDVIARSLSSNNSSISKLLGTFNSCSGKMIRPALVLLTGKCCGKVTKQHINVSAVIEMIHNATLLHDDVIDEGQKRRGFPTVNNLSGNETAVLMGDFLLSRASRLCSELEPPVYKKITDVMARICEGELKQITQKRNWQLSEPEYIDIITDKSASLFSCCCYLGAYLAGADEKQTQALESFGLNTGIAFQITDDLLDITGDESQLGKTLGCDADKCKLTLPLIHLLTKISGNEKDEIMLKLNDLSRNKEALIEILRSMASFEYVCGRASKFISKAVGFLDGLENSNAKSTLIQATEFIIERVG
ncbi:MAG: polyprenyl synthetase family protein [Planctomycetota bacterium]|jgi:octaprenyl-diphosphate synthase